MKKNLKPVYANTIRPWYCNGRKIWDAVVGIFIWTMIAVAMAGLGFAFYMMVCTGINGN